jgi:hypothetical protein
MRSGCEREEGLKANIVSAAHLDDWAQEDTGRRKDCEDFANKIKAYSGKPTEVRSKGLFEVFAEAIRDGQQEGGLINKIPPHHD